MLALRGLSKVYADGTHALSRVSFEVASGQITAIVGASGCGKSTLLRLLAGLDTPSAGSIALAGAAITAPHPDVGIVFQEARLFPWLRVADNVGFGLSDVPKPERRARVAEALARVGLGDQARRWPRELSGGQQQRVAIARALVTRPKVLLLDEPFSALDAFTRAGLNRHVLELWEASRPTVVIVTHDVEEAIALADRVIVMQPRPGRVWADLPIALPRPRARQSAEVEAAKQRVRSELDRSLATEWVAHAEA